MPDTSVFTVLAFVISAASVVVLGAVAEPLRLVDRPDTGLKAHGRTVPIVGGLAVFATLQLVMLGAGVFDSGFLWASLGLFLVGLYDDLRTLGPLLRLAASFAAGVALVLLGGFDDLIVGGVLVALVVVGVNAVNLLDGADGVAGSAGLVSALGLGILAAIRGIDPLPALILAGALGGFLLFNWPKARVFLGDGGAYAVGISLAYFVVVTSPSGGAVTAQWFAQLIVAFGLLGVFAIDLMVTLLRRWFAKAPLFGGDRAHVYDQLAIRGWSATAVAAVVGLSQALIAGVILWASWALEPWGAASVTLGLMLSVVVLLWLAGFVRSSPPTRARHRRTGVLTPSPDPTDL